MKAHIFLLATALVVVAAQPKVRLTDVESLVFQAGRYTTARRSSPVPQVHCVGGRCEYEPTSVICHNEGHDGTDVNWRCTDPEMPSQFKFGPVAVNCEGYEYPDDPYVLKGSCGLEYSIVQNPNYVKPQTYQHPARDPYYEAEYEAPVSGRTGYYTPPSSRSSSVGTALMIIIVLLIGLLVCSKIANRNSGGGGGGYGGDGGYPPQQPLPYNAGGFGSNSGSQHKPGPGSSAYAGSGGAFPSSVQPNSNTGPGFWSGMAGGGLMGYLFGRRNQHTAYGPGYGGSYGSAYSYGAPPVYGAPAYRPAAAPVFRAPAQPAQRPATAFATTRRR